MIHTIGHSTHPQQDLTDALHTAHITTIIDIRSHPSSTHNPQYNKQNLQHWLPQQHINYEWWPQLGGWTDKHQPLAQHYQTKDIDINAYCHHTFPRQRINKPSPHKFTNYGFYDYQYYQTLEEYHQGIQQLTQRQHEQIALLCCEARHTQCHRAMIADHLALLEIETYHIQLRTRKTKQPRTIITLTPHTPHYPQRLTRYEPEIITQWKTWQQQNNPQHKTTP